MTTKPTDFIRNIVAEDLKENKNNGKVITRFPPEPNGYLHIGHAKSISLNFGIASENNGICNLRFDDTNPEKESLEYIKSIKKDVQWLGFKWHDKEKFASDYFEHFYNCAIKLIKIEKAYVCDLCTEEIRKYRGTLTEPGIDSPYRNRTVDENLELFEKMKNGEFKEGSRVLRAKIDMKSPNMNMRDPALYRIKHVYHHGTGDKWCIYPMYDFAHCVSDSIEGITHSICTLEFEDHRPLYDWILDTLETPCHPQQIEFARLNLNYTIMSKRKLLKLVEDKYVESWDDPRMPTISGMKRRGYPAIAIRNFCDKIGVAKKDSVVDIALLEFCIREDLNKHVPRVMGVLNPIKVVIENYPDDKQEELDGPYHPEDESLGSRKLPFSKELYIEKDDFKQDPPRKYFRLAPGKEVRLRYAYYITCKTVEKDENGEITKIICTYDPETKGGSSADGRKVKGTIHWVSAKHAISAEVRLYDRLFNKENPDQVEEGGHFTDHINPESLKILKSCYVEPSLAGIKPETKIQFERIGYFCVDSKDSSDDHLVFNRTVGLRDSWAKIEKKQKK